MKLRNIACVIVLLNGLQLQAAKKPLVSMFSGRVVAAPTAARLLGGSGFIAGGGVLLAIIPGLGSPDSIVKLVYSGSKTTRPSPSVVSGEATFRIRVTRDPSCDESALVIIPTSELTAENLNSSRYVFNQSSERKTSTTIENLACFRVALNQRW